MSTGYRGLTCGFAGGIIRAGSTVTAAAAELGITSTPWPMRRVEIDQAILIGPALDRRWGDGGTRRHGPFGLIICRTGHGAWPGGQLRADPWHVGWISRCPLTESWHEITVRPSDANDGQAASIVPLADYGVANFEGASMTDHSNQSGGFISSAWPSFYQVTQSDNPRTGTILASPGSLYGGQAYSNTWHAAN
jgi:hypothetical protein